MIDALESQVLTPNQGPNATVFIDIHTRVNSWSIAVLGHPYRVIYIHVSPAPPRISKISKSAEIATPVSQHLALERRNGPNPSDRSIGMPMGAHKTATEDKCDSSSAYLLSCGYHKPRKES